LIEVLVITISNPLLIGIYENKILIKEHKLDGKTSDLLPSLFDQLLKDYNINKIIYVNSPGSFMSIKVAYIFLKTISITKNIELKACEGFEFNQNSPIKALGKKYFIKDGNKVKVDFLEKDCIIHDFKLPMCIEKYNFNEETLPIYNLPAV
jgi:tRNA A37 threonylcarbamoyladenosine modification protein TsaB